MILAAPANDGCSPVRCEGVETLNTHFLWTSKVAVLLDVRSALRASTMRCIRSLGAGPADRCHAVAGLVESPARDGRCLRRLGVDQTRFCLRPGYPSAPVECRSSACMRAGYAQERCLAKLYPYNEATAITLLGYSLGGYITTKVVRDVVPSLLPHGTGGEKYC